MRAAFPIRASILALGAVILLGVAAHAQTETLQDALAEAYNTNPQLLSERAHLRAVDENVPQALANWRPTVAFTGMAGAERQSNSPYEPSITYFVAPPGCTTVACAAPATLPSSLPAINNVTPNTIDVNITQPLYRGGRTVAQTAQAEKTVESERAKLVVTEESILYSVIQAYLDVVRDQATVTLAINNEQLLSKQLAQTREEFRVGTVTRTDVAQAEAQYATAVASRNQAEGNLQVSRANYERAVGHLPPKLQPTTLRPVLPRTRQEALTLAAAKNPNVIAALFAEDAARDEVNVIKGQLLPTLSVVGDYQRLNDVEFQHSTETAASVEARVTVPLYEGGAVYSQTRQAIQTVGQLQGATDDSRRAAVQSATQAWETIDSGRAQLKALEESVRAAQVAFQGSQAEQRVGTVTILQVLITEQTLFSDQVQLVSTQHDEALAEFNLAEQIGRLTAADLNLKVKLYDVNTHYKSVRDKWLGFGSQQ